MEGQLIVYIVVGAFQVLSVIGGGVLVVYRAGRNTKTTDFAIAEMSRAITEIKTEVVAMRTLMTDVALQKQELSQVRSDVSQLRSWYDELRHGEGMVFPFGSHLSKKSGG